MASPSNVFELLPEDLDPRRGLVAPDLQRGVLVVMISNPSMCGFCRLAEPEFHAAANMARGLELVKFATVHLDRDDWGSLDQGAKQSLLDHISRNSDRIPDYAFLVDGKRTPWKPIDRSANTIYSMAHQLAADIVNGVPAVTGDARQSSRPHHGSSWYVDDMDDDLDEYEDDQDLFSSVLSGIEVDGLYGFDDRAGRAPAPGVNPGWQDSQCTSYGFCS